MKQNLKKWFQPIRIEKIVDLVKRDFLIGGIEYEFNLRKFIDINVRDREIWLDKRNLMTSDWLFFRMASGDAAVAAQTLWAMRTDKAYMAFQVSFWLVDQSDNLKYFRSKMLRMLKLCLKNKELFSLVHNQNLSITKNQMKWKNIEMKLICLEKLNQR